MEQLWKGVLYENPKQTSPIWTLLKFLRNTIQGRNKEGIVDTMEHKSLCFKRLKKFLSTRKVSMLKVTLRQQYKDL